MPDQIEPCFTVGGTMTNERQAKEKTLTFFDSLFNNYRGPSFTIQLWDGSTWHSEEKGATKFTLSLNHQGALKEMFLPPTELSMGEAYIYGDFDLQGDIFQAIEITDYFQQQEINWLDKLRYAWMLWSLPQDGSGSSRNRAAQLSGKKHSISRDRQAISYHYDVSNEFYSLFLDKYLNYSCAYFAQKGMDIHQAQKKKMDYICKKLRLKPGEKLLDIGCGWGGQIIHAAKHYDVEALGITLSENQVELAQRRIREEGLEDRCRVKLLDYREILDQTTFDKIVSVGMVEHVGEDKLPEYFQQAYRLLKPRGLFLNHGIAATYMDPNRHRTDNSFSEKYVFPDGELSLINTMLAHAESSGFEVRDVESLREHYAQTLRHWVSRLEDKYQEALQHVEETTYRIWRLYMSASAKGFEIGRLNIYQSLLSKQDDQGRSGHPRTRADLYL